MEVLTVNRSGIQKLLDRGMSRTALAKIFDCSRPTFNRWLNGDDPQSVVVTRHINDQVAILLRAR